MTFSERQEVDDLISADFPLELSHISFYYSRATMTPRLARAREQLETVYHLNGLPFEWNGIEFSGQMELHFFFH